MRCEKSACFLRLSDVKCLRFGLSFLFGLQCECPRCQIASDVGRAMRTTKCRMGFVGGFLHSAHGFCHVWIFELVVDGLSLRPSVMTCSTTTRDRNLRFGLPYPLDFGIFAIGSLLVSPGSLCISKENGRNLEKIAKILPEENCVNLVMSLAVMVSWARKVSHLLLRILFSFFCPVHPTLPQAIFFPQIVSFWDLRSTLSSRENATSRGWVLGTVLDGVVAQEKRKILFFVHAKKR